MKVILYIGHHKVGSTSLQVFLSQNWLKLARQGILYPSIEAQGMAHNLKLAMRNHDEPGILPINIREPHNALAFRFNSTATGRDIPAYHHNIPNIRHITHAIHSQLEELEPHTVILCSEVLSNFGALDPSLINKLCDIFPGADFQVYCTLRRPDEYLASWHGQRMKFGHEGFALRDKAFSRYLKTIHFDYRVLLEAWCERVPQASFAIRNYGDVLAEGGSIDDFMVHADVDFPENMLPAPRANKSIPYTLMEIARLGNKALSGESANALRRFLLNGCDDLDLPKNSAVELFGQDNRDWMFENFSPIETWLRELTGREAFFPDLERVRACRDIPEHIAMRQALTQMDDAVLESIPERSVAEFLSELRQDTLAQAT